MIKIFYILFSLSLLFSDDDTFGNSIYYFEPGPNLISFNTLPENTSIETIFESVENNLISIISEGQICHQINNDWVGTLNSLDYEKGYWIIASDVTLIDVQGYISNPSTYFLNTGANLISYPYDTSQSLSNALPFYMLNNLIAVIGENEAALFYNNQIYGSLTEFQPNQGYWFITNEPIPFEYNEPIQNQSNSNVAIEDDEIIYQYNQSTQQSIFFIEEAYFNGEALNNNYTISASCNNGVVGGKIWDGEMMDITIMGNDGYTYSENYCEENQTVSIQISNENITSDMYIIGNHQWINNNISIIALSNYQLGDINFDNNINVTDIIIAIEHIIDTNIILNNHQLLLSDINSDNNINVTDILLILESIIE